MVLIGLERMIYYMLELRRMLKIFLFNFFNLLDEEIEFKKNWF